MKFVILEKQYYLFVESDKIISFFSGSKASNCYHVDVQSTGSSLNSSIKVIDVHLVITEI